MQAKNRHRITQRPIVVGAAFVWLAWLALMISGDRWELFADKWYMSLTMCFGSFIAGATSEGGGAVAFPVMTLLFNIAPAVARDFSLMIQSVGMMAAAFTIFAMRIPVIREAIFFAGIGGAAGIIVGLELIAPNLPPAFAKMFFTSFWLSFALALYWMNRNRKYKVRETIRNYGSQQAAILIFAGFVGGIVSGITGSGLDIVTFSVLVLGLRISEKVATPTSVVLMGMNAVVGFAWKGVAAGGMAPDAWSYWYVCVPIVVVGAPLGAYFIRNRSRYFVAGFLYVSIVIQYVAALAIIPQTPKLIAFSVGVLTFGLLFFRYMANRGLKRELHSAASQEYAA